MMSRKLLWLPVAAAAALTMLAPAARAGSLTGADLYKLCTANMGGQGNALEAAECMGFVVGVSDTFNCTQSDHGFTWDSTADVSQPQLVATVVQWLDAHPDAQQFEGHRVVGAALAHAYPCK